MISAPRPLSAYALPNNRSTSPPNGRIRMLAARHASIEYRMVTANSWRMVLESRAPEANSALERASGSTNTKPASDHTAYR